MYSPADSGGQGGDLVDSSAGDAQSSRLIPRGTHTGDEELVFRTDSRRSKAAQNHSYMASISTGQKARHTMMSAGSTNSSSTSINQLHSPRPASSTSDHGGKAPQGRQAARSVTGSPPELREYHDVPSRRRPPAQAGHQRRPSIDARGYLRALNELFFGKFCVDELFCCEFREQLVRRIQESTFHYAPEDLQDILDDVVEACKSTRLSLDVVSQWRLNYFVRNQAASVIDHIFLMNANTMAYDPKYSSACLDVFCADPLCSEIHAGRVTEEDKAKAFRRVLNVVLNEALRVRLVTKEQKTAVRARLVKSAYATEDRIGAVRELAVLVLLGQDEARRDLASYAVSGFGKPWTQSDISITNADEDCNLDPDMVYRKAQGVMNNTYLESILDVRRLGMSISVDEVAKLRTLWARHCPRSPDSATVLTLPMLLHLLVHCSESELQETLPQAGVSIAVMAKAGEAGGLSGRIEQVEDAALQIVQNLGLAWELGDNPPRDLRQFCMVLLLDLGSVLSKLLVHEAPSRADAGTGADADAREIGVVEDGLFAKWWDVCDAVVRFERSQRRYHAAFVVLYIKLASEKLLAQKADFNPELFLTMVIELLTEYRKRRPDYEAIVLTPDGRPSHPAATGGPDSARNSGNADAIGQKKPDPPPPAGGRLLDRRAREDIGCEFDRLFAWVDQQLPAANCVRSLSRASSPKSRTASWQTTGSNGAPSHAGVEKARSPSTSSVGYGSSTGGTRVASTLPPVPVRPPSK
ncbi:hypothetical protein LPJ61_003884 [Coemansia biformis]|uniref:Uncharacterized protein n=1 Tax=Coemansia biformis TaxID=1286918 RepID=A0A9W7Y9Q0_9FUNG|nr:hypothetical protein LPJ61_003884 [Coemansia biformis]